MIQFVNNFLKKSNKIGFFFVLILGTLLHFSFAWLREAPVAGLFSAVNESTWEHMKLLFFPSFLYFLWEYKNTVLPLRICSQPGHWDFFVDLPLFRSVSTPIPV